VRQQILISSLVRRCFETIILSMVAQFESTLATQTPIGNHDDGASLAQPDAHINLSVYHNFVTNACLWLLVGMLFRVPQLALR
jgi:hypothetical protein